MHPRMKIKELAMESNVMLYRVAFRISDVPWKIRWKITRFYISFKRRWKEAGTIRSGSFSFIPLPFPSWNHWNWYVLWFFDKCTSFLHLFSIFYFIFYIFSFFFFLFIAHVSLKLFREREREKIFYPTWYFSSINILFSYFVVITFPFRWWYTNSSLSFFNFHPSML